MVLLLPEAGPDAVPQPHVPTGIGVAEICAATGVPEEVAADELIGVIAYSCLSSKLRMVVRSRETGEEMPIDECETRKEEVVVLYDDLANFLRHYRGRRFPNLRRML